MSVSIRSEIFCPLNSKRAVAAIIVIVFLPLFTLQGVEGKTFRPLAYTVSLAMAGSLIFAIVAAPVFADMFMRRRKAWRRQQAQADARPMAKEPLIVRGLLVVYRPVVRFFVAQRWAAVVLALLMLIAGVLIFPRLGSEFTPRLNEGDIIVNMTMAPSISLTDVLPTHRRNDCSSCATYRTCTPSTHLQAGPRSH